MQIRMPFEAAMILSGTSLKDDQPDVWQRYQNNHVIRFGRTLGARVYTSVGRHDLEVIRDYFDMWLHEQSLLSEDDQADRQTMRSAAAAVSRINYAITTGVPVPR